MCARAAKLDAAEMAVTALFIAKVASLFLLSGLSEIGGGWLVWMSVREGKPMWWAVVGSAVLVAYGFIPTLQPLDDFGRLYAVYGGIFIGLSFLWGARVDGMKVDAGDLIGSLICFVGVCVILFWKRDSPTHQHGDAGKDKMQEALLSLPG